jgi:hypothetical protein
MRPNRMLALLGATLCVAELSAQQPARGSGKATPKTLTLSGCVARGSTPNQFTITDEQNGKYEVKGSRIGRYLGQRVEIAGSQDNGRLKIRGGLYPNPNAAAQGGSRDPVRTAMDGMPGGPGSGTGDIALPTFNVKSVKTLGGGCG